MYVHVHKISLDPRKPSVFFLVVRMRGGNVAGEGIPYMEERGKGAGKGIPSPAPFPPRMRTTRKTMDGLRD